MIDADIQVLVGIGKYIYDGGITGVIAWLLYDIYQLKNRMSKTMEKQDVVQLVQSELALVKQEQTHMKEQLDRIEDKLDAMREDLYLPATKINRNQ